MSKMKYGTCEKCNGEIDMYYGPWCPRCDKPQRKTIQHLNLLQAMRHTLAVHYPDEKKNDLDGIYRKVWLALCDTDLRNNADIFIPIAEMAKDDYNDEEIREFLTHMVNDFDLTEGENLLWEVSW